MVFSLNISDLKPKTIAQALLSLAVFMLPFQIFTIVGQPDIHLSGQMNQFTNATIYLNDILIILSAIFYFPFNLKEKIKIGDKTLLPVFLILGGLIFWKSSLGVYGTWLSLLSCALLYLLIINDVPRNMTKILLASAAIQAVIAITQFIFQGSIGLGILGEPDLHAANIAKVDLAETKIIRAYGTMPHPNILAGLLVITIILASKTKKHLPLIILCAIGLLLTFSRSAAVALATTTLLFAIFNLKTTTKFIKKYLIAFIILLIIGGVVAPVATSHLLSTHEIEERLSQVAPTIEMIKENPFKIGFQNYTTQIQSYTEEKLMPWEYQPVHNVYLLTTAELGIIGVAALLFLLIYSLIITKNKPVKYALLAIMVVMLFDHYFYTLHQGQLLMLIILGLSQLTPKKIPTTLQEN